MNKRTIPAILLSCFFAGCIVTTQAQTAAPNITALSQAIRTNPSNATAWYNRGMAYYKTNKYSLAISDFTKSLELAPDEDKTLAARGNAYFKAANYDSAIIDYSAFIDGGADDKNVTLGRADAYRMKGRYREAVQDYSDVLDIDSTKDITWFNRGLVFYKLGKYDSSITDFTKALKLHPNTSLYTVRLLLAECSYGYYAQAALHYNTYKQKKTAGYIETPEYLFLKNYIIACTNFLNNSDYAAALPLLQQAQAAYKPVATGGDKADSIEYANIVAKTGWVYEKMDSLDKALEYYTMAKAISANVQGVAVKFNLVRETVKRNTVPPVIRLDSPAHKTRGQFIEADVSKKDSIYVKGLAHAPAGVTQLKVNGVIIPTDTAGIFQTYISDTFSTIHIEAFTIRDVSADTTFSILTKKRLTGKSAITALGDEQSFHAIFIANTDYSGAKWQRLDSTISEAERFKNLLIDEYNFSPENVDTLYNKSKIDILRGIRDRLAKLNENDNVLIFYGGHGDRDEQTNAAYWVPVNTNDRFEYISNNEITQVLNHTQAKHILVMADACFSSLLRSAEDVYVPNKLDAQLPSRQLLTSGNAEAVPGVSVFIPNIMSVLRINSDPYLSVWDLYNLIYQGVKSESGKQPIIKYLEGVTNSGAGQFYFKRKMIDSNYTKTPEAIEQEKKQQQAKKMEFAAKLRTYDSLIAVGKAYKANYQVEEALTVFKNAMVVNPEPSNTYAKNLYDETNKLFSMTPQQRYKAYMDTAAAYEDKRQHIEARNIYIKLSSLYPAEKANLMAQINALSEKINFVDNMQQNYFKFGQYREAAKVCSNMIKKQKTDPEYYYWRAKCYAKMDNFYYEAVTDFKQAITLQATYSDAIRELAELYRNSNKKREAITAYTQYININKDPGAFMELYKLHSSPEINLIDEAIEDLTSAVTINSTYSPAYYSRGVLYFEKKQDYKKAFNDFNTAVQTDSTNPASYFWRGTTYLYANKLPEASMDYKIARSKGLDSFFLQTIEYYADSINSISIKYDGDKLYDSAINAVNRAILVDPFSPIYRYEKGNYYYALNNFAEAIKNYDSAVYFKNTYNEAFYKRGLAYYNLGKYNDAIDNFDKVLKLNAIDVYAMKGKADAYYALADYTNAAIAYELALKTIDNTKGLNVSDSIKSRINNNLGFAYYQTGSLEQSITALKRAIHLDENYALAYYNIGKSYQKNNDLKNAAENIDKALTYNPTDYIWNYSAAEVYKDRNDYPKAIGYYTTCIDNDAQKALKTAYYYRGYSYSQVKDDASAVNDYVMALHYNLDTGFQAFNNELGAIYLNLSNTDSAYLFYNKSFLKDSTDDNAKAMYGMACALMLQKKGDEALVLFEKSFKAKLPKAVVKSDKNYDAFREDKRFKTLYNKYY